MMLHRSKFLLASAVLFAPGCLHFDGLEDEVEMSTHVNDWRDQVIYQVLIDRFEDADEGNNYRKDTTAPAHYHGGDWAGLESRLDYLEALGVTALWISPVIKNVDTDAGVDGYHGYWAQDFNSVNPHFGNMTELRSLVNAAHEHNMLVIIDIVTNHVGQAFYYDINLNGQPDIQLQESGQPGKDSVIHITEYDPDFDPRGIQAFTSLGEAGPAPVIFQYDPATNHIPPLPELFRKPEVYNRKGRTFNFDDPDQLLHGDFPGGLKDIDTTRCDVKREMVDIYANWIEQTDADGFRIDTVKHVEWEFWRFFTQRVRQRLRSNGKTNFLMFGEAFDGRDDLVGSFTRHDYPDNPSAEQLANEAACAQEAGGPALTGDQLDSVFYFPQHYQVFRDVFQQAQSTDRIEALWDARSVNYGTIPAENGIGIAPNKVLVNFIDNHDVARFLWPLNTRLQTEQRALLQNALLMLLTEEGIPCIYYGTEQEFDGGNDPANREDMWDSDFDTSGSTFQWTARLISLRKKLVALRRGDTHVTWSTDHIGAEQDAGIFAFERTGGEAEGAYALVIFNTHQTQESATIFENEEMPVSTPPGTVLVDVLSSARPGFTVSPNGTLAVALPPMRGALLVPESEAGGL